MSTISFKRLLYFVSAFTVIFIKTAQAQTEIHWSDLKPAGTKIIMTEDADTIAWPVFKKKTQQFNHTRVKLTGFYREEEALADPGSAGAPRMLQLVCISKKYTSKVCGVGQFDTGEFVIIKGYRRFKIGSRIMVTGYLLLNETGSGDPLIVISASGK